MSSTERRMRAAAAVAATLCFVSVAILCWRVSLSISAGLATLASPLILVGLGMFVGLDLFRRTKGYRPRRWFGGVWSQLLFWNVWNVIALGQMGDYPRMKHLGLAISLGLLALALVGESQEGHAAQPGVAADGAPPRR